MCYNNKIEDFLDRLQRVINDAGNIMILVEDLEEAFPELKERKDEKVRKALLEMVHDSNGLRADYNIYKEEAIAWLEKQGWQNTNPDVPTREVILSIWDLGNEWKELTNGSISTEHGTQLNYIQKHWHESEYYLKEKQGEQKPTDVELKFKVGDWVVNKFGYVYHIDSFDKKNYQVSNNKDLEDCYFKISDQDQFHLWTIDDAKDGDALTIGNECFLFKGKIKHNTSVYISHCFLDSAGAFRVTNGVDCGEFFPIENGIKVHPATKEQRDLLFQKMKEAGYNLNKEEE